MRRPSARTSTSTRTWARTSRVRAGTVIGTAAVTVALTAGTWGCARTAEVALPEPVTVTVLPAADAPPKPVGAGPVTTGAAMPAPSTTMVATVSYTVQVGDTLSGIADQFGTSFEVLVALNNLTEPGRLGVGQVLVVPEPPATTVPPPNPEHTADTTVDGAPPDTATDPTATTLPPATKEG
ncbi:MAG: LysM peptidoglycan-binding domain-containing protein [Acidimicrobiales bacterium]